MGLTLGASLVTVCELLVYLIIRMYSWLFAARKNTDSTSTTDVEGHQPKRNNEQSAPSMYI